MKKISLILIAVLCMAFISCNNNTDSVNPDPETVTPNELLRNIPVTTEDLRAMLESSTARTIRSADEANENSDVPQASDLIPFVLKTFISETTGFEFGKNKTIGIISEFSENAKREFAKVYGDNTDVYLESFQKRDWGTVNVNMEGNNVTIFWYIPNNFDGEMNFPECSIFITGIYKNGSYENIELYGEGYSYGTDENGAFKAFPIYEKKYVSGDKVISKGFILKETTLSNNTVIKIEITANGKIQSTESYSNDLPAQAEIDSFQKKISDWKLTVSE